MSGVKNSVDTGKLNQNQNNQAETTYVQSILCPVLFVSTLSSLVQSGSEPGYFSLKEMVFKQLIRLESVGQKVHLVRFLV